MKKSGFSLIELLVVVAIIAILVGVATPYYSDYVKESKRTKAKQDLDALKQAVVLFNSQEDSPYLGVLATGTTATEGKLPILGETDFNGLQGTYLTYVPTDPWGKNYKLDPYGCFVYSEGPTSDDADDIKEYYVKDLALTKVEWEDLDNDRTISLNDKLYFSFNKSVWCDSSTVSDDDFLVYENNTVASTDFKLGTINFQPFGVTAAGYTNQCATVTTLVTNVNTDCTLKIGVHSLAIKAEVNSRKKFQEVAYDREKSDPPDTIATKIIHPAGSTTDPLRYIITTNPVKIVER